MSIDWCKSLNRVDSRSGNFCNIYKNALSLNPNATKALFVNSENYVLLGYDKERNIIAIKPLKEPQMGVRKVTKQKSGNASIGIITFLKYYPDIEFKRKISYCPITKESDYFVCDLNKGQID